MSKKEKKIEESVSLVVQQPVSREEFLKKIAAPVCEKVVKNVGLVRFRLLSFEDHYKLQAYAEDSVEFAARCMVMGFIEPKLEESDIPAIKSGLFGPVAVLGALPLGKAEDYVKEEEVAKPQSA